MYLTYVEYLEMGGTLDETAFSNYEFSARSIIDWYTFGRLQKEESFSENVKRLMYRLITIAQGRDQALLGGTEQGADGVHAGVVASQSNDGFSTSFNVLSADKLLDASNKEISNLVNQYLQFEVNSLGQKLLFRGMYPNE